MEINKEEILEELKASSKLQIQQNLLKKRQLRMLVMVLLLFTLLFTVVYSTLENPFQYTLSMIGNRFTYREWFIIWGIVTGFCLQTSSIALFKLEGYQDKKASRYVIYGAVFLVLTAIIPAIEEKMLFWHRVHMLTAVFYALFFMIGVGPFVLWVSKENPRLRKIISIWIYTIVGGSVFALVFLGMTGIFEVWFIVGLTLFLMYLSMTLFEEEIVKESVRLLRDEENLNLGIEKIFINLEEKEKTKRKKHK